MSNEGTLPYHSTTLPHGYWELGPVLQVYLGLIDLPVQSANARLRQGWSPLSH